MKHIASRSNFFKSGMVLNKLMYSKFKETFTSETHTTFIYLFIALLCTDLYSRPDMTSFSASLL